MHTTTTNTIWKHRVPRNILKFLRFFFAMHLPVHCIDDKMEQRKEEGHRIRNVRRENEVVSSERRRSVYDKRWYRLV